jgi:hypothetical protein
MRLLPERFGQLGEGVQWACHFVICRKALKAVVSGMFAGMFLCASWCDAGYAGPSKPPHIDLKSPAGASLLTKKARHDHRCNKA